MNVKIVALLLIVAIAFVSFVDSMPDPGKKYGGSSHAPYYKKYKKHYYHYHHHYHNHKHKHKHSHKHKHKYTHSSHGHSSHGYYGKNKRNDMDSADLLFSRPETPQIFEQQPVVQKQYRLQQRSQNLGNLPASASSSDVPVQVDFPEHNRNQPRRRPNHSRISNSEEAGYRQQQQQQQQYQSLPDYGGPDDFQPSLTFTPEQPYADGMPTDEFVYDIPVEDYSNNNNNNNNKPSAPPKKKAGTARMAEPSGPKMGSGRGPKQQSRAHYVDGELKGDDEASLLLLQSFDGPEPGSPAAGDKPQEKAIPAPPAPAKPAARTRLQTSRIAKKQLPAGGKTPPKDLTAARFSSRTGEDVDVNTSAEKSGKVARSSGPAPTDVVPEEYEERLKNHRMEPEQVFDPLRDDPSALVWETQTKQL